MVSGPEESDDTVAFTSALARLKREGSNLLVVGTASDTAHATICDRLLGDAISSRWRTVVSTERGGCVTPPSDAALFRYESTTRSATAVSTSTQTTDGPSPPDRRVEGLVELGDAIADNIDHVDAETGGLTAAQYRLCLDSLRPLLEEHTERDLFRFLHAVTNEVRSVRGMGHYHLPVARDEQPVETLKPLFDAVVEVRTGSDGPQQRWHIREADAETEWLPL